KHSQADCIPNRNESGSVVRSGDSVAKLDRRRMGLALEYASLFDVGNDHWLIFFVAAGGTKSHHQTVRGLRLLWSHPLRDLIEVESGRPPFRYG
ncbi:MAG: hypothetical protein VXY07_12600, partial [Planctomycetota bacterium]|nr:hypothetical protein [Planctomycetota bacterium]